MKIIYPTLLILAILAAAEASQDIPIQAGGYGFSVGDPYGTLHIEFFLDFQCPDSKDQFKVWTNVRKSISLVQNHVKLTYQFNPLPYHFYAARIHTAFFYVLKKAGSTAAEDFIAYVFDKQDELTEEAYIDKTGAQFDQEFSQRIAGLFGLDTASLVKELQLGSESFVSLMNHWRYTTIQSGVAGAPLFQANGVLVDGAEGFSYQDWISFIEKYRK